MFSKEVLALVCTAVLFVSGSASVPATTKVHVPGIGDVLMRVMDDGTVEALGIPFAAPPVGPNRFKPPQPATYHGNFVNATAYGNACMQLSMSGGVGSMSEDCLNLNIWSPPSKQKELLPVFFWIHGGGFLEGAGKLYNGSHLASLGIVVVTINYRLGGFGWFASDEVAKENPQAPGNGAVHGFLDQILALRWVHQHIAAFGGDVRKITIGGESAGSLSTCVHLHLPVSKDLFRRAIMESGSCVAGAPWVAGWNTTTAKDASRALTASVNATDLASLRDVSADAILKSPAFTRVTPAPDGWYMKKNPGLLAVQAEGVDIIVGANTMDTLQAPPYIGIIPQLPDLTPKSVKAYYKRMTDYFGEDIFNIYPRLPSDASADAAATAFYGVNGDVCNTCPKHWAAQKFLAANETVFVYEFGYASGHMKGLACHGCEIADVFDVAASASFATDKVMKESYTPELGDAMSKYWANFVKTGEPRGEPAWDKYSGNIGSARQLHIATNSADKPKLSVDSGLDSTKCEFFEKFIHVSDANNEKYTMFCNAPVPLSVEGSEQTILV